MILPKKLGPRIHIHKDMIFLYDPFWLEREDGTYLIDWAEREEVDKIKKYLKGKENPAAVFQLFSFPVHRVSLSRVFGPPELTAPTLSEGLGLERGTPVQSHREFTRDLAAVATKGRPSRCFPGGYDTNGSR